MRASLDREAIVHRSYINGLPPAFCSSSVISIGPPVRTVLVVLSPCSTLSRVTSLRFLFLLFKQLLLHLCNFRSLI